MRTIPESLESIKARRDRWLASRMDEDMEADPTSPKLVICVICRKGNRWFSIKFNPKGGSFHDRVEAHLRTHDPAQVMTDKQRKKGK